MRVVLHLEWSEELKATPPMKRRVDGFNDIKQHIAKARDGEIHLHAFTYAFLRKAKNIDLYVEADDKRVQQKLYCINRSVQALEALERDGAHLKAEHASLKPIYLALRRVVARAGARDERRALVHLLMNGPCTDADLAADLVLSENLAIRIRKALQPGLGDPDGQGHYGISDAALPVVVFLVRETTGIDPLSSLIEPSQR